MSLIQDVIDLVNELGEVTGDDLLPHCPYHSREQVMSALQQARFSHRIRLVKRGRALGLGESGGSTPGTYGPIEKPPSASVLWSELPPCSVWELGRRAGVSA